jgi:hypothetical protein
MKKQGHKCPGKSHRLRARIRFRLFAACGCRAKSVHRAFPPVVVI